ncbi:hypothetical protein F2P81_019618 [Scophthalmus maximus]|uniref:Uncharacterized protein n=1 Tax=Scophthalmus maximus TaxID=52904 RepID=A0A6A4SBR2_SCOMX|nr:hypothetical protein F2P81_019618 [Scophthalmus maximus]
MVEAFQSTPNMTFKFANIFHSSVHSAKQSSDTNKVLFVFDSSVKDIVNKLPTASKKKTIVLQIKLCQRTQEKRSLMTFQTYASCEHEVQSTLKLYQQMHGAANIRFSHVNRRRADLTGVTFAQVEDKVAREKSRFRFGNRRLVKLKEALKASAEVRGVSNKRKSKRHMNGEFQRFAPRHFDNSLWRNWGSNQRTVLNHIGRSQAGYRRKLFSLHSLLVSIHDLLNDYRRCETDAKTAWHVSLLQGSDMSNVQTFNRDVPSKLHFKDEPDKWSETEGRKEEENNRRHRQSLTFRYEHNDLTAAGRVT